MKNYKSFDGPNLLKQFSGDEEILFDMINVFQESSEHLLLPIKESIHNKDAAQLKLNAHTFKGVLSNFYSEEGRLIAEALEHCGDKSRFDKCHDLLEKLEKHLKVFNEELNFFKKNLNDLA